MCLSLSKGTVPCTGQDQLRTQAVETYVHVGFARSALVATCAERMQPVQSLTCAERMQPVQSLTCAELDLMQSLTCA
jgi:hypothetical protein